MCTLFTSAFGFWRRRECHFDVGTRWRNHVFLLSGYLIFKNLQHKKMFLFIGRRLFKIFPAFWGNVLVIASLGVLIEGYPRYSLPVYLTNFFLVSDVFKTASISGVYWTLLIEVKFYMFIAIYYFFLRDRYIPGVMLVVVIFNVLLWAELGKASQLFTFAPIFFIGIQAYLAEKSGWSQRSLITLALMAIMAGLNVWVFDAYYNTWSLAYLLAGTVSLLFLLRSNISNVALGFFGRISYSRYLYHTSVGYLLFGLFAATRSLAGNIIAVSIVFLATSMLAYISYRYIELPFVRAGKSLEAQWSRV